MQRAVFLDRDGVINHAIVKAGKPYSPMDVSALKILPGVPEALLCLHDAGYLCIVVTNQPNVARGIQTRETIEAIHQTLLSTLTLDEIRVCYHDDADRCDCRKPAPGLLFAAAASRHLSLTQSFMVGDRWRDIEAGLRAGCRTIFIDYGYDDRPPEGEHFRTTSLAEAVAWILKPQEVIGA